MCKSRATLKRRTSDALFLKDVLSAISSSDISVVNFGDQWMHYHATKSEAHRSKLFKDLLATSSVVSELFVWCAQYMYDIDRDVTYLASIVDEATEAIAKMMHGCGGGDCTSDLVVVGADGRDDNASRGDEARVAHHGDEVSLSRSQAKDIACATPTFGGTIEPRRLGMGAFDFDEIDGLGGSITQQPQAQAPADCDMEFI